MANVRTDMPREDPLLLSADLDTARDASYLPVISVLFGNLHGNSRVASSGKASKKNLKQGLLHEYLEDFVQN